MNYSTEIPQNETYRLVPAEFIEKEAIDFKIEYLRKNKTPSEGYIELKRVFERELLMTDVAYWLIFQALCKAIGLTITKALSQRYYDWLEKANYTIFCILSPIRDMECISQEHFNAVRDSLTFAAYRPLGRKLWEKIEPGMLPVPKDFTFNLTGARRQMSETHKDLKYTVDDTSQERQFSLYQTPRKKEILEAVLYHCIKEESIRHEFFKKEFERLERLYKDRTAKKDDGESHKLLKSIKDLSNVLLSLEDGIQHNVDAVAKISGITREAFIEFQKKMVEESEVKKVNAEAEEKLKKLIETTKKYNVQVTI